MSRTLKLFGVNEVSDLYTNLEKIVQPVHPYSGFDKIIQALQLLEETRKRVAPFTVYVYANKVTVDKNIDKFNYQVKIRDNNTLVLFTFENKSEAEAIANTLNTLLEPVRNQIVKY